jgi:hypothetical protein
MDFASDDDGAHCQLYLVASHFYKWPIVRVLFEDDSVSDTLWYGFGISSLAAYYFGVVSSSYRTVVLNEGCCGGNEIDGKRNLRPKKIAHNGVSPSNLVLQLQLELCQQQRHLVNLLLDAKRSHHNSCALSSFLFLSMVRGYGGLVCVFSSN